MSQASPDPSASLQPPQAEKSAKAMRKEALLAWFIALLFVLALAVLAQLVGLIAANLYVLVAAVFIGLAALILRHQGLDPERFGLHTQKLTKNILWGLLFTAFTLPPFLIGQNLWETQLNKRRLVLSAENYAHWPVEIEGQPARWGSEPGAWIWSERGVLYLGMRATSTHQNKLILSAKTPFIPVQPGGVMLKRMSPSGDFTGGPLAPSTHWELVPKPHHRPVTAYIQPVYAKQAAPLELTISSKPVSAKTQPWTIYTGQSATPQVEDAAGLKFKRGYLWILLWVLTQLFFIALPEEYFYRGYLQTRLSEADKLQRDGQEPAWLGFTPAIFWTSVLFGLGHLLVPVGGALFVSRFSVFFPSLLFGWLRRRTQSIVAPMVYHACCNLMVLLAGTHYY